jgi:general L-amino acid transport system substrate-binding protein
MMRLASAIAAMALALAAGTVAASAGTLDDVRARGALRCGVSEGLPGFSDRDTKGVWSGFDVDFCRAVAAALFASPAKVEYTPVSAVGRFPALTGGKIDVLSRNSSWTAAVDVGQGLDFAGISYHDGQGFLLPALDGFTSALQLEGAVICVIAGTTTEASAAAYFDSKFMKVRFLEFPTRLQARAAYVDRKCDVFTADRSALAAERSLMKAPDDHVILPEVITKEPLGPVTREGDPKWTDFVRWVLFGLINAEENGITSTGLADPALVGAEQRALAITMGKASARAFALPDDWLATVIEAVGNYGEIFDRNLGEGSALRIGRGINALWTNGGILYAPPM